MSTTDTATGAAAASSPGMERMPVTAAETAASAAAAQAALAAAATPPAMTREAAKAELAKLKADPEFGKRLLAGGSEEKAKWASLLKASVEPDAEAAQNKALAGGIGLLQTAGIDLTSPAGRDLVDVLAGKPISVETRRTVEAKRALIMKDPGFADRYLRGDPEARRTMTTLNALMVAKVEGSAA